MIPVGRTTLLLVRHGHAAAAERGVIAGPTGCTGLSDLGRRQAEALRDRLSGAAVVAPDVVLTSVLPRAIETAAILASAFGGGSATQHCDLCELHPGDADGLTWDAWRKADGFNLAQEPDRVVAPGGESFVTFAQRVRGAVQRVTTEHAGQSVAIVCHGGVIVAASLLLMGFDESVLRGGRRLGLDPANTSLTEWERDDEGGRWTLVRYNDAAHLEGLS